MHIIFTEEEREWIDMKTFGCPIIDGCPNDIRKSIEEKKKALDNQKIRGNDHASQSNR